MYHRMSSNDKSVNVEERRERVKDSTQLQLPHNWGAQGVEVIASRVRIYWLPHHWNFILRCK